MDCRVTAPPSLAMRRGIKFARNLTLPLSLACTITILETVTATAHLLDVAANTEAVAATLPHLHPHSLLATVLTWGSGHAVEKLLLIMRVVKVMFISAQIGVPNPAHL